MYFNLSTLSSTSLARRSALIIFIGRIRKVDAFPAPDSAPAVSSELYLMIWYLPENLPQIVRCPSRTWSAADFDLDWQVLTRRCEIARSCEYIVVREQLCIFGTRRPAI
jgi:hypothetical protein